MRIAYEKYFNKNQNFMRIATNQKYNTNERRKIIPPLVTMKSLIPLPTVSGTNTFSEADLNTFIDTHIRLSYQATNTKGKRTK